MKKYDINKLRLLTNQLTENATYLGLSESTIQNMLKSAFESNPGLNIEVTATAPGRKVKCQHYDLMPHHPLPNCTRFENKTSKFD